MNSNAKKVALIGMLCAVSYVVVALVQIPIVAVSPTFKLDYEAKDGNPEDIKKELCDLVVKRYEAKEEEIGESMPIDQYGLMKYTINQIIERSNNIYNMRLFGIFGKYEYYPTKFISLACCKAIKDLPLVMRQNVYFDYLWVNDFCRMLEKFLHSEPKHKVYNMVSGQRISLEEICTIVKNVSNKDLPVYICKDGVANEYTASNRRFLDEFKSFEYTPIEESIKALYEWYEKECDIDLYKLLY